MIGKKKGFTLVELLVTIAIMSVLMLVAIPKFIDLTKGARVRTFESNFKNLMSTISQEAAVNNGYIATQDLEIINLINQRCEYLKGKPSGASYELVTTGPSGLTLKAKLPAESFGRPGESPYEIIYNVNNGEITSQSGADGLRTNFISAATP